MIPTSIIFASIGAFFTGTHLFLLKCFTIYPTYFSTIMCLFLLTFIFSRYFLFEAMKLVHNPVIVNCINSFSIYIVLLLSIIFLDIKHVDYYKLNAGIILMICGIYLVVSSHK